MLYAEFIKEILVWQGIFDGYPENHETYRLYFELIQEKIKTVGNLHDCLKKHHDSKNRLFPKPFELIENMPFVPENIQQLRLEVEEITKQVKFEQGVKNGN